MSAYRQIIEDLKNKLIELENTRAESAMIMMSDALELVALRIQNTGVNSEGAKMPPYSKTPSFYAAFLDPAKFNAPSKIKKFKEDYRKGKNTGSYEELRKAYGLPLDRTLTFDGSMFNKIKPILDLSEDGIVVIYLGGTDELTKNKIKGNIRNAKTNFLALSEDEQKLVNSANLRRIKKIFEI